MRPLEVRRVSQRGEENPEHPGARMFLSAHALGDGSPPREEDCCTPVRERGEEAQGEAMSPSGLHQKEPRLLQAVTPAQGPGPDGVWR